MEDLIFPSKIGNKDLKKESRGGLISKGEGLKAKAVVPECDTFSRDPKTSWCKSKNVHSIARSFNSPSRFYSFSSASQPPTRPKLHLFEIEGAYSPLFFLRLCFLSFSLSLSLVVSSLRASSRRHSKEGTGNGSPLLILRHTAEIFEVCSSFQAPLLALSVDDPLFLLPRK